MDELRIVLDNECCPCCGQELPEHFRDRAWRKDLKVLHAISTDSNHQDLSSWSLEIYSVISEEPVVKQGGRNAA